MKGLWYGGATICLVASLMVAQNSRSTPQVVLPNGARSALIQTGRLPVQVQQGNSYADMISIALLLAGLGIGAYASFGDKLMPMPTQQENPPIDLRAQAIEMSIRTTQEALNDARLQEALRQKKLDEFAQLFGVQVREMVDRLIVDPAAVELSEDDAIQAEQPSEQIVEVFEHAPQEEVQKKPVSVEGTPDDPLYRWIKELLEYPCIRVWGSQGGGKTSKLIYMMEQDIKQGKVVMLVNPLAPASKFKGIKVYGRGYNFNDGADSAAAGLQRFAAEAVSRLKRRGVDEEYEPLRDEPHWALYGDEMTNWGDQMDQDIMGEFWQSCTQMLRQANMSFRGVTHGNTNQTFGGAALRGKKQTVENQFAVLRAIPKTDPSVPGGLRCSGTAVMKLPEKGEVKVSVPGWMRESNRNFDFRPLIKKLEKQEINSVWEDSSNVLPLNRKVGT